MEVQITQDIRKYKTKDLGNFSFKEVGIIALAVATGLACYKLKGGVLSLSAITSNDSDLTVAIVPMFIILAIGFLKPFGMSFVEFCRTVLVEEFFHPRLYYNETDFQYDPEKYSEIYGEDIEEPSDWNVNEKPVNFKHSKEDMKEIIK